MGEPTELDLKAAGDICFRADVGESVQQNILIKETWERAIYLAKAEAFERRLAYSVVEALEAAAGSKTK